MDFQTLLSLVSPSFPASMPLIPLCFVLSLCCQQSARSLLSLKLAFMAFTSQCAHRLLV